MNLAGLKRSYGSPGWCGSSKDPSWAFREQDGTTYTVDQYGATLLNSSSTTTCPNGTKGACATSAQITPTTTPYPPVPECIPSADNFC